MLTAGVLAAVLVAQTAAPPERWLRELALEDVGSDTDRLYADPFGGVWAAVTGSARVPESCRVWYRPPQGAWQLMFSRHFCTEPSLSSVAPGEVHLAFNDTPKPWKPRRFRITAQGAEELDAPALWYEERGRWAQVGALAMRSAEAGWACGEYGLVWRRDAEGWVQQPPIFPWDDTRSRHYAFCAHLALSAGGGGRLLAAFDLGAELVDGSWRPAPPAGSPESSFRLMQDGLIWRDGRLLSLRDGAWRDLLQDCPAPVARAANTAISGIVADHRGGWIVNGKQLVSLSGPGCPHADMPFAVRAIASNDAGVWLLTGDGIYRSTDALIPLFRPAPRGALPTGLRQGLPVDFDGDGHLDLLAAAQSGDDDVGASPLVLFRNNGAGRFIESTQLPPTAVNIVGLPHRFDAGDVDGDGDTDLLVLPAAGGLEVWLQQGDGMRLGFRFAPGQTLARLVDLDRDGDLDIGGYPHFFRGDGAGHFRLVDRVDLPFAGSLETLSFWDADDDGDLDAMAHHWSERAALLRQGPEGHLQVERLDLQSLAGVYADLDLDGAFSMHASPLDSQGEAGHLWRCSGDAEVQCAGGELVGEVGGTVVDLNGDGRWDRVYGMARVQETQTIAGHVYLSLEGDGALRDVTSTVGSFPYPTVFDADGDGDVDIYTAERGLLLNAGSHSHWLRIRPRPASADRLGDRSEVVVRRVGSDEVVASGIARRGEALLGLPEAGAARYDVELRFPDGQSRWLRDVAAGQTLIVSPRTGLARLIALAQLHLAGTRDRIRPGRDVWPAVLCLIALLIAARRWPARRRWLRASAVTFTFAFALLLPFFVRSAGVVPWTLSPAALGLGSLCAAAFVYLDQRRRERRVGPYSLRNRLGRGAAATVWRARRGREEVALKVFSPDALEGDESRQRFLREAHLGMEVSAPNLVRIRDFGVLDDGRSYLAMRLIEGETLAARLEARGHLAPAEAVPIARDLCAALVALHEAGVVHRDVKPENILVEPSGRAVLTDLGLARSVLFRTVTRSAVAVGSLAYMSPEQCVGQVVDGRSDLWAVGVVLYEMLSGRRPFGGSHELELVYMIHNVDPEAPTGTQTPLDALVLRCLKRRPEERFESAAQLLAALEACAP